MPKGDPPPGLPGHLELFFFHSRPVSGYNHSFASVIYLDPRLMRPESKRHETHGTPYTVISGTSTSCEHGRRGRGCLGLYFHVFLTGYIYMSF
jgi:hypothetical protein